MSDPELEEAIRLSLEDFNSQEKAFFFDAPLNDFNSTGLKADSGNNKSQIGALSKNQAKLKMSRPNEK